MYKIIDGKAKLTREDYCDGLGDCLPSCPKSAISFEEREAPAYDEAAVLAAKAKHTHRTGGCPGSALKTFIRDDDANSSAYAPSRLMQWPVQIKLLPVKAHFFEGAELLIAADCTAFTYGNMHEDFIKGHITLVGCPKLDDEDYSVKLGDIVRNNNIKSITVVRMEVPCCGGIEHAAKQAIINSGKSIPFKVVTISTRGDIL